MHFRIRQNVVQLIRTEYDDTTKKPKTTIVASLRRAKPEITDDLKKQLSKQELTEVNNWIAGAHRLQALKEEVAALSLADTMALSQQWFARQKGSDAARAVADQAIVQWQSLRGQLKKDNLLD